MTSRDAVDLAGLAVGVLTTLAIVTRFAVGLALVSMIAMTALALAVVGVRWPGDPARQCSRILGVSVSKSRRRS